MGEVLRNYLPLFLGILIVGTPVLLPSVWLAARGDLSIAGVLLLTLLATVLSDSAWYLVGRSVPLERLERSRFLRRGLPLLHRMATRPRGVGWKLLFASRFLYGTRIAIDILCGVQRMRQRVYLPVNLGSAASWFAVLLVLAWVVGTTTASFLDSAEDVRAVLALLVVLGIAINLLLRWFTRRRILGEG